MVINVIYLILINLTVLIFSQVKRPASHSGSWYNSNKKSLKSEIDSYLTNKKYYKNAHLKAIITPHAGYYYSGRTTGAAFSQVNPENFDRVIVLGPTHYEYFPGILLTSYDYLATPFGDIKVDTNIIKHLLEDANFKIADKSIDIKEHSIEMELPFIKHIFDKKNKKFNIVPMIVGEININAAYAIARKLEEIYLDERTLFVISSDFCHWGERFGYTFYDETKGEIWQSIQYYDSLAFDIISKFSPTELENYFHKYKNTICGRNPILLLLAMVDMFENDKKNIKVINFNYEQSEKVRTFEQSSVSYFGIGFYKSEIMLKDL